MLGEALPSDTLSNSGQSLPANTCLFHPTAGESHPSRLRASISSLVTASASRPPNFTFPSSPVRQWVLISRRMPERTSRPDNLTFSTPRPTYLSVFTCPTQRAWTSRRTPARARQLYLFKPVAQRGSPVRHMAISKPVGRRQEPPRQQPHLFLLDEAYPSDTAISKPVGRRRKPTGQSNLSFPFCGRQKLTQPRCRLTARLSDHVTLPFCLNLSTRWAPISRRTPARALPARQPSLFKSTLVDANRPTRRSRNQSDESLPARQSYLFKSHARRGLPFRHGNKRNYRRTLARASQPDNLTFHVPRSARLTRPTRQLPKPTSARASQPDNPSFPSARTIIRTPPNATHSTIKQP